jgi:tRNA(Arg) A34 adenosine deaminase TadA
MNHEKIMQVAVDVARDAISRGELPFAAALVDATGTVVLTEHDRVYEKQDPTQHAETLIVQEGCRRFGPNLSEFTLYTTCEPCAMCFTSAWLTGIRRIVMGTTMAAVYHRSGRRHREMPIPASVMNDRVGGTVELTRGVLAEECIALFREDLFLETRPGQS